MIWFKFETPPKFSLASAPDLPCAPHPKTHILGYKQREEEDFPYPTFFYFFNQQTIQPPKCKSNPKQVIQNSNQAMEEEDFSFPTFFFFNQQTILPPNNKNNPKQAFQNAIATLLLLSHKKKLHTLMGELFV